MILALMQPYFFPYVGYFDLINVSDEFVVFDTAQFIKGGWINRNRVLHQDAGWQYVTVPIEKHPSCTAINRVETVKDESWKRKILGRLTHLKKHAPYYDSTTDLVENCLASEERSIARFNVSILKKVCEFIGINFCYKYISEISLSVEGTEGPGDWAFLVASELGAQKYVNLPGGGALFDRERFERNRIGLEIRKIPDLTYDTANYTFESRLSIIDVLMWNSPQQVHEYLMRVKDPQLYSGQGQQLK